jgi:carbamoyl-phosphate synthase small subunit
VVPFDTPYERIAALAPDGVLTSPGPGNPENAGAAIDAVRGVINAGTPYFGVCLGHQLLGLAVGATTSKLKFGHRGGNHPVLDLESDRVYITSQNHGYQVDMTSIPEGSGWHVSKINLNDGSVEGISHETLPVIAVQYHPEGSPGPQDSQYLFDEFVELVRSKKRSRQTVEVAL